MTSSSSFSWFLLVIMELSKKERIKNNKKSFDRESVKATKYLWTADQKKRKIPMNLSDIDYEWWHINSLRNNFFLY